jgi:hypothetical protein
MGEEWKRDFFSVLEDLDRSVVKVEVIDFSLELVLRFLQEVHERLALTVHG